MPKLKTSRSAAKRFSTTGSGKFRRRRQALRHILTKKDAKRRMRLGQSALVDSTTSRLSSVCCPTPLSFVRKASAFFVGKLAGMKQE